MAVSLLSIGYLFFAPAYALGSTPSAKQAALKNAQVLASGQEYDAAEQSFLKIIENHPGYTLAHMSLAKLYRTQEKHKLALIQLEKALQTTTDKKTRESINYNLALAHHRQGHPQIAKRILRSIIASASSQETRNERALFQLAVFELRDETILSAHKLDGLSKQHPDNGDYHHQAGIAFRRLSKHFPKDSPEYIHMLAKARRHLEASMPQKANSATAHFDLGVLYRHLGETANAIEHYESATALDPLMISAWWDLGLMYKEAKRLESSRDAFSKVIVLSKDNQTKASAQEAIDGLQVD